MKKSKLLAIIDKAINEVLSEDKGKDEAAKRAVLNAITAQQNALNAKKTDIQSGKDVIPEAELDEARRYGIADAEKAQALIDAASGKAKGRIQQIVDAINAAGGRLSGGGIANAIGVIQPQINSLLKAMVENGIIYATNEYGRDKIPYMIIEGNYSPVELHYIYIEYLMSVLR